MTRPNVFGSMRFADAMESARRDGNLLVVDATAAWCQPCKLMDRTTWSDPDVATWLGQHALAIQIDVDEEQEIAASLRIKAMPTVDGTSAMSNIRLESAARNKLVALLIAHQRWADAGRLFVAPHDDLRRMHESLLESHAVELPEEMLELRERIQETMTKGFIEGVAVLHTSLRAAGRRDEAQALKEEARRLRPEIDLEPALRETAEKARLADEES